MTQRTIKPYMIGLAGGSASGKTSVCQILFDQVGESVGNECVMIALDSYYKPLSDEIRKNLSIYNFDHPNALDFDLAYFHLSQLLNSQEVQIPQYDFKVSQRLKETTLVKPAKLIIFEGILAFHDKRINALLDMKIFVDTADDIRLMRRIYRDIKDRGRELHGIIDRYNKFVKPCYEDFIKPTRKFADVIIPRGYTNTIAVNLIIQNLLFQFKSLYQKEEETKIERKMSCTMDENPIFRLNLIDNKHNFLNGAVIVFTEESKIKTLKRMFQDIIEHTRSEYSNVILKFLTEEILKLHTKELNFFNDRTYYIFTEIDKVNLSILEEVNRLVCFYPCLITKTDVDDITAKLFSENLMKKMKKKTIYLLCLYSSTTAVDSILKLISDNGLNSKITTLYYSDELTKYSTVLKNGIRNEQTEFSNEEFLLSTENYCDYFKSMVRRYFN